MPRRPPTPLAGALLILLLAGRAAAQQPAPPSAMAVIDVRADHLQLDADGSQLTAEGDVEIRAGNLVLRGERALLDPERGVLTIDAAFDLRGPGLALSGRQLVLSAELGRLQVIAPRILLPSSGPGQPVLEGAAAVCQDGRCSLDQARGTACPHDPSAYHLEARQVLLHPSGDVDLSRPVLFVDDTPVAALPWLRVRPAGSAGLLPPRLAYDSVGGLIVGPAGQFPLGDRLLARGHVAARTAQGVEASSSLLSPAGEVTVFQLYDFPAGEHHARARAALAHELGGATLALDADLVDGYPIIDALTFEPLERARSHTNSQALLAAAVANVVLETRLSAVQALPVDAAGDARLLGPTTAIALSWLPPPLLDLFWPTLDLAFTRHDAVDSASVDQPPALTVPPYSKLAATPALWLPRRLGPLVVQIGAASLHQLWLPDGSARPAPARHLVAGAAEAELPLVRRGVLVRHLATPLVRYRITPWVTGRAPGWVHDGLERLAAGHGVEAGIGNEIGTLRGPPLLHLELTERFDLPGFGREPGPAYLYLDGGIGPAWLALRGAAALDHRHPVPSFVSGAISTSDEHGNRLETGLGWYGRGRGPQIDGRWTAAGGPWLPSPWPVLPDRALALFEEAAARLTANWSATAGARVGIYPDPGLQALWYGLELRSTCGCLVVGLTAAHRPSSWIPDVLATLRLLEH